MPTYDPDLAKREERQVPDDTWYPMWWLNGHALRYYPQWTGRGIFLELDSRAYWALMGTR